MTRPRRSESRLRRSVWLLPLAASAGLALGVHVAFRASLATPPAREGARPTAPRLAVWLEDGLRKVLADAPPTNRRTMTFEAVRGEREAFQVVARAGGAQERVTITATPPTSARGESLPAPDVHRVELVGVGRRALEAGPDERGPSRRPDALRPTASATVEASTTRSFWLSVRVPRDAEPGDYHGLVTVASEGDHARLDVRVTVLAAELPPQALWYSQRFSVGPDVLRHLGLEPADPEAKWTAARLLARSVREGGGNVGWVPTWELVDFAATPEDEAAPRFDRLDRWIELLIEEGLGERLEGSPLGERRGGWESPFGVRLRSPDGGATKGAWLALESAEARAHLDRVLPALARHLAERGWLERYHQNVANEPTATNLESYVHLLALARAAAPTLRWIVATHTPAAGVAGVAVVAPQLDLADRDFARYDALRRDGRELWFYTCMYPRGSYANRFIEQPLLATRVLGWLAFRYGFSGYLHWAHAAWPAWSPFDETVVAHPRPSAGRDDFLPGGDSWIVYPDGRQILGSLRVEAMRDGLEDHALLTALAARDPGRASALAARVVRDFDAYELDPSTFAAIRRELLRP